MSTDMSTDKSVEISAEKRLRNIRVLEKEITVARERVYILEDALAEEVEQLQKICVHDYERLPDGDFHRPGWEYTCRICRHWTRNRPTPSTISYPTPYPTSATPTNSMMST